MADPTIKLDVLQRILSAPNERQLAAATLTAFQELLGGHYYAAITWDLKTRAIDLFHPAEGWLGPNQPLVQAIQRTHGQHPFVRNFFPLEQAAVYRRSELQPDLEWQRTEAYNEVDRLLGIRDMVAIFQPTDAGQLLVLTVGRDGHFRASELEPVRRFQQVLNALWTADCRLIPVGQSGVFVRPNEILCITGDGNYSTLLTTDQRKITARQTLAGWLATLPVGTFLQADRTTIVNLRHISRADFCAHGATLRFDVPVPALTVGRNAARKLKRVRRPNS